MIQTKFPSAQTILPFSLPKTSTLSQSDLPCPPETSTLSSYDLSSPPETTKLSQSDLLSPPETTKSSQSDLLSPPETTTLSSSDIPSSKTSDQLQISPWYLPASSILCQGQCQTLPISIASPLKTSADLKSLSLQSPTPSSQSYICENDTSSQSPSQPPFTETDIPAQDGSLPPSSPIVPPFSPIVSKTNDSVDTPLSVVICHEKLSSQFAQILPDEYSYIFKENAPPSTDNITLRITVFTDVISENEARKWISRFESHTNTVFQITRGVKVTGSRILYKTYRHCHHMRKCQKVEPKVKDVIRRSKKTECPSKFTLKVHKVLSLQSIRLILAKLI